MAKVRLNKYIDCGDYYEVILTNKDRKEIARAKVDKGDVEKVKICRWGLNSTTGTTQGWVNKRMTAMHIVILGKKDGYVTDHINHDVLDNRRSNIRHATKSQNAMNQRDVAGVYFVKRVTVKTKKWAAQIYKDGKHITLGYFLTREEATKARREAEKKYYEEFAYRD